MYMKKTILTLAVLCGIGFCASAQSVETEKYTEKKCVVVRYYDYEDDDSEIVYVDCDSVAMFPGGADALFKFFAENMQFPDALREVHVEGYVYVQFNVEKDGSLTNVRLLRDLHPDCGKEALRLVSIMPKWIPASYKGEPIVTTIVLPISFSIQ